MREAFARLAVHRRCNTFDFRAPAKKGFCGKRRYLRLNRSGTFMCHYTKCAKHRRGKGFNAADVVILPALNQFQAFNTQLTKRFKHKKGRAPLKGARPYLFNQTEGLIILCLQAFCSLQVSPWPIPRFRRTVCWQPLRPGSSPAKSTWFRLQGMPDSPRSWGRPCCPA